MDLSREELYRFQSAFRFSNVTFENVSPLVTSPDVLSRLQDSKLDGGEKNISFQWRGPHFLTFLRYVQHYLDGHNYLLSNSMRDRFTDLLMCIDGCLGERGDYRNFLEFILCIMPDFKEFFQVLPKQQQLSYFYYEYEIVATFINFVLETIGDLLNCGTYLSVVVSNQVKVLPKELNFLVIFFVDTVLHNMEEQNMNILTEIEAVFNEVGLFLHSFFFTADLVTATKMDQTVLVLLERIRIVQVKIKDECIVVSKKLSSGIGSLQVAEASSQDKSISIVEETVVGFENMTKQIASHLREGKRCLQIISIVGMPGLGKTTLAKKIYNDFKLSSHFDTLSWCVVSQTYKKRKLLIDILSFISNLNGDEILKKKDEELAECLYKNLKGRRYLIVMDDLWDKEVWDDLKKLFPDDNNGSRILFTSRLNGVASETSHFIIEPPPLSQGECWDLLEKKVFMNECCPQELQAIGKKIAANCKGLPLLVVVIASVLSNMEKKKSLWQHVAKSMSSYISDDYISILKLSYKNLPTHLKPCFLYLSAFEEDEAIPVRKLLLLWIAEGFIEKKEKKSFEDVAEEYLMELVNRNLLQVAKRRSDNGVRYCTVHDLILEMCWKIAEEEKFMFQHQFLISKQRHRLCMEQSHHYSKALSILYNSEKIRIMDSLSSFKNDIFLLGIKATRDLRYLEISSLDSSIERFKNLEFLRVKTKVDILPTYLLSMPKLRHLHVGDRFQTSRFRKNCNSSQINNLQAVSFVRIFNSKDEEILECSPNLRSLKCVYSPDHHPDLNFLTQLESLKMVYQSRFDGAYSIVNFPKNIKKLTLSESSLPWDKMSLIGILPNLEILKLGCVAFIGKIWNTKNDEFLKLKFLKLHYLDIEQWNSSSDHFPELERLILSHCERLEMVPFEFSNIPSLQQIDVHFCGINVENSALEIRKEQQDLGNEEFEVNIYSYREYIEDSELEYDE